MNNKFRTVLIIHIAALFLFGNIYANNVTISNGSIVINNSSENYALVQFSISWDNSWRTHSVAPNNHDAVWVFMKYRVSGGDGVWRHAKLNNAGHVAPSGSVMEVGLINKSSAFDNTSNPGVGVFLYRSEDGSGTFSVQNAQLRWNYGANGVSSNANVEIKVFALEMVYIPQGSFFVGSGGSESNSFYTHPTTTNPFQITSESSINVGNSSGYLFYTTSGNAGDASGPIPAGYPKGYNSFYCMKYEISQGQYRDFLNTLTYTQQAARTQNSPSSGAGTNALFNSQRNGIDVKTPGVNNSTPAIYGCNLNGNSEYDESSDGEHIACNYLGWNDLAAYLDWSGLRPMTELEYEKACRGNQSPVPGEFAWGTATFTNTAGISNSGMSNETQSNGTANCSILGTSGGPMRGGSFGQGINTRTGTGAGYYGVMELSGNIWERAVTVGNSTGRSFTGLNGDGELTATGTANVLNWPSTDAVGASFRGADWADGSERIRVSDRYYGGFALVDRNNQGFGGRGVR